MHVPHPPKKVVIPLLIAGAGGAYYLHRKRAAADDVTSAELASVGSDTAADNAGLYSSYLPGPTSGVASGGYGGSGVSTGFSLDDVIKLVSTINPVTTGSQTGGGAAGGVNVSTGPGQPAVDTVAPVNATAVITSVSPPPIMAGQPLPAGVPLPSGTFINPAGNVTPIKGFCPSAYPLGNPNQGCYKPCEHTECGSNGKKRINKGHCYSDGHRVNVDMVPLSQKC